MVPMSEFDSAVASEGYLATTIDRKDQNDQCRGKETSFLNGKLFYVYLPIYYSKFECVVVYIYKRQSYLL